MLIMLVFFSKRLSAQCIYPSDFCTCVELTMPPDAIICPGSTYSHDFTSNITIPPGCSIDDWDWSPSAGVTPASGTFSTPGLINFTPSTPGSYTLTLNAFGPNVLANGDFSSGASCFTTAYTPYSGGAMASLPGTYAIDVDIVPYFITSSFLDHSRTMPGTSSPFNMMMVDGSASPGTLLWEQSNITTCSDVDYEFSFWLANVVYGGTTNNAKIRVVINGVPYGPFSATGFRAWERQSLIYHSPPGGGPVVIQMYDDDTAVNANDFAIDDIAFRRTCKISRDFYIDLYEVAVTGPDNVCVGSKIKLTGLRAGGTWSASGAAVVDAVGNVLGVTAGTAVISYTTPDGCIINKYVTVLANPVITGPSNVCDQATATFTGSPASLSWSHTGPMSTTTTAGVYKCYTPGISVITYTNPATGCYDTHVLNINPNPLPIKDAHICIGDTRTFSTFPLGGTWTSSRPAVATINPTTGFLTGVGVGSTVITYTTIAGCTTSFFVSVYSCGGGVVVGPGILCEGTDDVLIGLPSGGTWTSSNPSIATIDPVTGVIHAVPGGGGGAVIFTYTVGTISKSVTISVVTYTTACIETKYDPGTGYSFDFTSSCPGTATVRYLVYSYSGSILGFPTGYTETVSGLKNVSASSITSLPHGSFPSCAGFYRICITDVTCGGCTWPAFCCDTINAGSKSSTSVNNIDNKESLAIMPNPNKGTVTISGTLTVNNDLAELGITITDILGKTVHTDKAPVINGKVNKNIDLSANLTNGIYFVKLTGNGYNQVSQLILNR